MKIFNHMTPIGGAISVIGAGTMGNGIAHVFAQAGFKVTIVDISLSTIGQSRCQHRQKF